MQASVRLLGVVVWVVGLNSCGYPTLERLDVHDVHDAPAAATDVAPGGDAPVTPSVDAAVNPPVDASVDAVAIDAAPGPPDCPSYCSAIQTNCTGTNAQYPDMAHCTATCALFSVGTRADLVGNTLGCRLYHAGSPAMASPEIHCVHAGPGGDRTSAAAPGTCGDACTSFCAIEVGVCGTVDAPISGVPAQYQNMNACISACAGFDHTHPYAVTAIGNSLACRLYHVTNAAISQNSAVVHCTHTQATPTGPCAGTPSP
jgi:hypothetical protein